MQHWKGDIEKPIVSICSITYNHENYIAEAIDGFLMQETDFPFEVIVRDDASPDSTAEIIREYEKKYPNIIKPIYEKENGYQKGIKAMPIVYKKAIGKYIALCEGDDYWTDPLKLQKQVDFLEGNEAYVLCGTRFLRSDNSLVVGIPGIYTLEHFLQANGLGTLTAMFRKNALTDNTYDFIENMPVGDWPLWVQLCLKGNAKILKDITAIYNIHDGGVFSKIDTYKKYYTVYLTMLRIYERGEFNNRQKAILISTVRKFFGALLNYDMSNKKYRIKNLLKENKNILSNREYYGLMLLFYLNYFLFRKLSWRILGWNQP